MVRYSEVLLIKKAFNGENSEEGDQRISFEEKHDIGVISMCLGCVVNEA